MKFILRLFPLLLTVLFILPCQEADAQRDRKKRGNDEYFDESGGFAHRLWYGGGFNLGFSGVNGNNTFLIGISPMVGYKIIENISIGPRVAYNYTYLKGRGIDGNIHKTSLSDYSVGIFGRAKVIQNFFIHLETEFASEEFASVFPNGLLDVRNGEIYTERQGRNNFYLGAGYNSSAGALWGYEIVILYNFSEPDDSLRLPFDLRFGLTYNF